MPIRPYNTIDLTTELASRQDSMEWWGLFGYLPDPDPILKKTGHDITVYRMLLSDAHVWSCYQSRKSGVLSQEWEVLEPETGGVRANRRAVRAVEEMMRRIDVEQAITDMLDAPFFGMAPIEVLWRKKDWQPEWLKGKPPEWFVFSPENALRFLSKENQIEGEPVGDRKFLLPRHHATYQNPYGERVLSRCFWPVTFKRAGFKFWAIFVEKYGMPWVVGKVPRGTPEDERANVLAALEAMVQDAVAVMNDDESVEFPAAPDKGATGALYEQLISMCNREISKALLGQTLSTELEGGGSYAAAKSHLEVRQDLIDQDKRMVADAFNTLFRWMGELNGWAESPTFGFYEEEDLQLDRAARDKELAAQGAKFTRDYFLRTYNLEEEDLDASMGQYDIMGNPVGLEQTQVEPGAPAEFAEKKKTSSRTRRITSSRSRRGTRPSGGY